MSLVNEMVEQARRQLSVLGIDCGNVGAVADAPDANAPAGESDSELERLNRVADAVLLRVQELDEGRAQLLRLHAELEHLRDVLPLTAAGWPHRKQVLEAAFAESTTNGLSEWLTDWFVAAGQARIDAMNRLTGELTLPEAPTWLAVRIETAAAGFAANDWMLVSELLEQGADGIDVSGTVVPGPEARQELRLMLVRLALIAELPEEAARHLDLAPESAATLALRCRLAYLRADQADEPDRAEIADGGTAVLEKARVRDPRDLDVAYALIVSARRRADLDGALDAALLAIEALPSLGDVDNDLARLRTPPAELWVAVAKRAMREHDKERAEAALTHSEDPAGGADAELLAVVNELRAANNEDPAVRRRALTIAADYQLADGRLERACRNYQQALKEPGADAAEHGVIELSWADALNSLNFSLPLSHTRGRLERALKVALGAQRDVDLLGSESWAYMLEHSIRTQLSRAAVRSSIEHDWRGFVAACRAVMCQPWTQRRWATLADAARGLDANHLALLAARKAIDVAGAAAEGDSYFAWAAGNAGEISAAEAALAGADDTWSKCTLAWLALFSGRPDETVRTLQDVPFDPGFWWASQYYATALLLSGQHGRALVQAELAAAAFAERLDEYEGLQTVAFAKYLHGRFDEAEQLLRREIGAEPDDKVGGGRFDLAEVLILQGRHDEGLELLRSIARSNRRLDLIAWTTMQRPRLVELAKYHKVELPSRALEEHDALVARHLGELKPPADVMDELRAVPVGGAPKRVVALAYLLAEPLVRCAESADQAAIELLRPLAERHPEAGLLRDYLSLEPAARLAADVRRAAAEQDWDLTVRLVRRLLDAHPDRASGLLGDLMGESLVHDAVHWLASDSSHGEAAGAVVRDHPDPEVIVRIELAGSWQLEPGTPELDRFSRDVNAASVREGVGFTVELSVDPELEEDSIRIFQVNGEPWGTTRIDPDMRYVPPDRFALLDPAVREAAGEPHPDFDLLPVPAQVVAESGVLAQLLTVAPTELIAGMAGSFAADAGLSLDAPGEQAADEVALQAEEDHQRHDHRDEGSGRQ